MANKSGRSSLIVVLVFVVAGILLGYAFFKSSDKVTPKKTPPKLTKVDAGISPVKMTEEERKAYINDHITVTGLEIAPNMKPGLDEAVPGLLEVRGKVQNNGERKIDRVFLHVFPMNEAGDVISTHIENVAKAGGLLSPGDDRDFKFTIPDKKEFSGKFNHMLQ